MNLGNFPANRLIFHDAALPVHEVGEGHAREARELLMGRGERLRSGEAFASFRSQNRRSGVDLVVMSLKLKLPASLIAFFVAALSSHSDHVEIVGTLP